MADEIQPKIKKVKRSCGPRRTRKINLPQLEKQLMTVLVRDTETMMLDSFGGKGLTRDQSYSLVNYLKLLKDLKKAHDEEVKAGIELAALDRVTSGEQ
jgi:hypothetical protein